MEGSWLSPLLSSCTFHQASNFEVCYWAARRSKAFIWIMWIALAAIDSTNIKSKARQGWQATEISCHVPVCDNCCTWGLVVRWWLTSFSPCAITKSPYSVWVHTSHSWLLKHTSILGSNSQTLIECPCCDEFVGSSGSIKTSKRKNVSQGAELLLSSWHNLVAYSSFAIPQSRDPTQGCF